MTTPAATHSPTSGAFGLTSAEAGRLLRADGPNLIPVRGGRSVPRAFVSQFVHFFALLLWVAAALAFVGRMPELGVAIIVVVLVNGTFAFLQEHRAERAATRLRELVPRRAFARRDSAWVTLDVREIVAGDLVRLSAGDRVPADVAITVSRALEVDVSMMSGESVPARPGAGEQALAGTFVVAGEAEAMVVATGTRTQLAHLVQLTSGALHRGSPLTLEINRLVRRVAAIALSLGLSFFVISVLVGLSASDGFLFAIGVAVALVPEGLLPTVTLSLARGAQRMAGRNALVRRLDAVETLGATTFICTDKTGTLTSNEMQVVEVWTPQGTAHVRGEGYAPVATIEAEESALPALRVLAEFAAVCSEGAIVQRDGRWAPEGDPMEAALYALARRLGRDDIDARRDEILSEYPFDAERRRMSVILPGIVVTKGAPEAIFEVSRATDAPNLEALAMARRGLRVLAIASHEVESVPASPADAEHDLTVVGLVGLEDPPRPGVHEAIAACRVAGIRLAMVTGDHPATAEAIARDIGLWTAQSRLVTGAELPGDQQLLGALVDRDGVVLARVDPEQKLQIARALKARGHVLAMTGDGVNDGPALEEADVGVAMGGRGTDVARDAADLVLLDDNFATIVAAVEEGRATFENIRRFLTYHLTDNVAELTPFVVWALSGGNFALALGVTQILALDIGTDLLPALALGAEAPRPETLRRPLTGRHIVDKGIFQRVFQVLGPTEALVEMAAFVTVFLLAGWRPGDPMSDGDTLLRASGAAFTAVVLGQMANAFACRSAEVPPWRLGWRSNPLLVWAVAIEALLLLFFLLVPPMPHFLDHRFPTAAGFAVALLAVPAVLLVDWLSKLRASRTSAQLG